MVQASVCLTLAQFLPTRLAQGYVRLGSSTSTLKMTQPREVELLLSQALGPRMRTSSLVSSTSTPSSEAHLWLR